MLISKITEGYVKQVYDSDTQKLVSQEFFAGNQCDYEDEYEEPLKDEYEHLYIDLYHPYDMVQPTGDNQ